MLGCNPDEHGDRPGSAVRGKRPKLQTAGASDLGVDFEVVDGV